MGWKIVGIIPVDQIISDSYKLSMTIFVIGLICILLSAMLSKLISVSLTKPINILINAAKQVSKGDFNAKAIVYSKDEIGVLADNFNKMVSNTSVLMGKIVDEQKKKREYELELMQSQLNPHFLYNTLESISGLARLGKNEDIIKTVNDLAIFYKGVLSRGDSIISIEEELSIIKHYIDIQNVRYRGKFKYELKVAEDIYKYCILKLTLQPLIENSICHGLREKKAGKLIIDGYMKDEKIYLSITDDGIGIKNESVEKLLSKENNKSFGLRSVNERIKLFFGDEYGLKIQSVYGKYTTVTVTLPAIICKTDKNLSDENMYKRAYNTHFGS